MEKNIKKYHKLFFLAVAVILLYPTFQGGYVFALDWMVEPDISWADINPVVDSIGWMIYKIGAIIFSFGIFQRIFLFVLIYFLGVAGFRLARRTENVFAQYFAGLFLIFNPFVYARLIEQPGVAWGSLLFFWFLIYFLEYLEKIKTEKIIAASVCAALAVSVFAHSIFFIAATMFALLIFNCWKKRDGRFFIKTSAIVLGIIILLNANWLFSFARGSAEGVGGVQSFSLVDAQAFSAKGIGGDSVYYTALALQGYWGEYQDRFVSIRENDFWEIAFFVILFLAIFGLWKQLKKNDNFAKPLLLVLIAAYVLAIGIASPIFAPLANFLYLHFPLYIGLRESQKWIAVLVFFYAYFGSWGIAHFLKIKKIENYKYEWSFFLALLPVIFCFSIIGGMCEHLAPHKFPVQWQQAKNYLVENNIDSKILFFPWHQYAKLDFAQKNTVVPAQSFFGKNIIQGNNTEFGKVYSHSLDDQTLAIEKYVIKKDNPEENMVYGNFSVDMQKMGIQAVMLAKTEDWQKYLWLDRISRVEKVLENDKIIIYKLYGNKF